MLYSVLVIFLRLPECWKIGRNLFVKKVSIVIFVLSGILFLAALTISFRTILALNSSQSAQQGTLNEYDYRFSIFLPENRYSFFEQVIEGAVEAGKDLNCALSIHPISEETPDFTMAKYSGVDGIIVYPSINEQAVLQELSALEEAGIEVVLIEHSPADDIFPRTIVGTNSFDLGKKIGELAKLSSLEERGFDTLKVAIIYSEKSPGILSERELVEMGLRSALGDRLSGSLVSMVTDLNPLAAENLTYETLRNSPEINTLIFTDVNDTVSAAQVIVDMNLVGRVQIIGFGEDEQVLAYIENGIITGSVAAQPREIGYNAVKVLKQLCSEGFSEGYVDTGVQVIDRNYLSELPHENLENQESAGQEGSR